MTAEPPHPLPRRRLPGWLGPVLAAAAVHAGLVLAYVLIHHGDVSALVCADRDRVGRWPFECVRTGFGSQGFDGQFYYALARNPWQRHDEFLDFPAYRHSRIVYPALAWLLSGGDPEGLLWLLPAINLAAVAGLGGLGALLAEHHGRSPWWGVTLPVVLNVGAAALLRDLTDPVSILAASGLVTGWLLGWRPWHLAVWAAAAVFSREQNVAVVLIVLVEAAANRRGRVIGALAAALLPWLGWVCLLRGVYGVWPFVAENVSAPLAGIGYRLARAFGEPGTASSPVHAVGLALLFLQLGLSLCALVFRAERPALLLCLAGAGLAVTGGVSIFLNLESFTRVFWWMPFGAWLWSIRSGRRWPILLLSGAAALPGIALVQAWNSVRAADVTFTG
jgi:hypothetical protein